MTLMTPLPLILRPGRVSSHSQRASDQHSGAISPKQLALDRGNAPCLYPCFCVPSVSVAWEL